MSESIFSVVESFQSQLTKSQAIPVVGFLIVSPIKAFLSLVEIVVSIAVAILLGAAAVLSFDNDLVKMTCKILTYTGSGFYNFAISIANIVTLGLLANRLAGHRFSILE